mgnify:FL=1
MTDQTPPPEPDEQTASVTFIPWLMPALPSGEGSIEVTQVVSIDGEKVQTSFARQNFVVTGERYRLAATTLNSLSPEQGARGDFSQHLPHVVLNSASLPWQRSPYAHPPAETADNPPRRRAGWLAVLLFDENDPPPMPKDLALKELLSKDAILCAGRRPEAGENDDTPVTVIDIDLALFNAIAPTLQDLELNAHVRRVDPRNKASQGQTLAQSDYAVVVGNRLPARGQASVAHLVSLEGLASALPLDDGSRAPDVPPHIRQVRLVSLVSWSFTTRDDGQDFADRLEALAGNNPALQRPVFEGTSASDPGDAAVIQAFGLGYTAMNHRLRNGDQSVSWYRGPLLPVPSTLPVVSGASNPDALLRYDERSGMFDVSYSAAWQLGRLLALQNSAYASALYRWKLNHTQAQLEALEKQRLDIGLQLRAMPTGKGLRTDAMDAGETSRVDSVLSVFLSAAITNLQDSLVAKEP